MSLTLNFHTVDDTDVRGYPILYIGTNRVLVGDRLADYCDETDEQRSLPLVLPNGDVIEDDRDLHELYAELSRLGFSSESDCDGLILTIDNTAEQM